MAAKPAQLSGIAKALQNTAPLVMPSGDPNNPRVERVPVGTRPRCAVRAEKPGLEPFDRQRIEVAVTRAVAAAFEERGHAVGDEHGPADVGDAEREKGSPRVLAHAIVARAPDEEIAFLEGVRKDQRLTQFAGVHRAATVSLSARRPRAEPWSHHPPCAIICAVWMREHATLPG